METDEPMEVTLTPSWTVDELLAGFASASQHSERNGNELQNLEDIG